MPSSGYIKQITLPNGNIYDLKDANAQVVNTVTLSSSSWTSDVTTGYYKQTKTVSGMTANSHPDAKIKYPSGTTELTKAVIDEAANLLVEMETASGSVTFYAISAPTTNLTLYLKGV